MVLKRSSDLINNVKIGQDNETYFNSWGLWPFWSSDLKQSNEYAIKQPSDFWGKSCLDRYVAVQMSGLE